MSIAAEIAKLFVERAKVQHLKGRARDVAAIEFVIGAAAAVRFMAQEPTDAKQKADFSARIQTTEMLAVLTSARGYNFLVEVATKGSI